MNDNGTWQSDPTGRHEYRWHDGESFTHHVADRGVASTDPYPAAPTAPPPVATGAAALRAPDAAAARQQWQQDRYSGWQAPNAAAGYNQVTPKVTGMGDAVQVCLNKYVDFTGRGSRSEYWWFTLAGVLTGIGALMLGAVSPELGGLIYLALLLGLTLPAWAAAVRRLHDTDKSGWLMLLVLVPFLGGIIVLILLAQQGTPGANRYGPPAPW